MGTVGDSILCTEEYKQLNCGSKDYTTKSKAKQMQEIIPIWFHKTMSV